MFQRLVTRIGLAALAGLGLLLVGGPARADPQGWPLLQGRTPGSYSPARSYQGVPAYSRGFAPSGYQPGYPLGPVYAASPGSAARVTVRVPSPNAELWFNRVPVAGQGTSRTFATPPLTAGDDYHYTVRARWLEGGRPVAVTYTVPVIAGRQAVVDFRDAAGALTAVDQQAPDGPR